MVEQWRLQTLRKHIGELIRRIDANHADMSFLDLLMREVLAKVDVLSPFAASNDIVGPFDACVVILV